MANGILKNNMDAEDAVSETTCKAFVNFSKLRNSEKFKPWIMKILINEAYAIANKRKGFTPLDEDISVENNDAEIIDTIILWDAVQALSDDYRIVTILFYYEDMCIKEISKILNIPEGTVNSRLNRSRQQLKKFFMKEGVD
jgi:RNA polymerase sigma-70 factor (ECF subfamily)